MPWLAAGRSEVRRTVLAPLPIDPCLPDLVRAIRAHGILVLEAPPGTGKTTRVPPALLDAGVPGEIVVLEPRRLAARGAARRVACERGGELGQEVGYQVRHDRRVSRATRIRYVTEGILVRQLLDDPALPGVGCVLLDEFHERHLESDLALSMLQEVRETLRPDLLLGVMSATLDPEPLLRFLPGAAHRSVASALHPVAVVHLEKPERRELARATARAVRRALTETAGDVLVFLPGAGEIAAVAAELAQAAGSEDLLVLPLHGNLPADEQDRAVAPQPQRKVVLATNVAESSLTIEGVTAVVDTGLARVLRHDPGRGLDELRLEGISRASAEQRRGRAGRTGPGVCYRLWSKAEERAFPERDLPEVRRIDLAGPVLEVRAFAGRDPREFAWFEMPEPAALERADALLVLLGALDAVTHRPTAVGRQMLRHPLHPRLARMLVAGAEAACRFEAAELAALLAERDFLPRAPRDDAHADLRAAQEAHDPLARVALLRELETRGFAAPVCRAHGADREAARAVARARDQLAAGALPRADLAPEVLRRLLLCGFPDRVVQRTQRGGREALMVGGRGMLLPEPLAHGDEALFVALEAREAGGRERARAEISLASPIRREWLAELGVGAVAEHTVLGFEPERGRVRAAVELRFADLVLSRAEGVEPDPEQARSLLATELARDPWRWLGEQRELKELLARARWLAERAPELRVPALGEAEVAAAAASLLQPRQGFGELRTADVAGALLAWLPHAVRRTLEREAPERIDLPSGRSARIEYGPRGPTVAARLQEFFGLAATPRLSGGRVPLTIELLAPNHRPVQITQDLASFWANVYPQVRNELRRRYPRHSWPDDPMQARPEARPKPRR